MASSIERAEAEVQRAIADAMAIAKREGITLAAAEAELWTALLAVGRALLASFLARSAARPRPAAYEHEGACYALNTTTRRNPGWSGTAWAVVAARICRLIATWACAPASVWVR